MNKKLSVIVPVYKVEPYLRRCLDSILTQKYVPMEIILVDDGSPDSCGKICDEYACIYNNVKVIHQRNAGLSAARNSGLKIATGDYISFVDSDDSILPGMYEEMIAMLEKNNLDIISCAVQRIKKGKIKTDNLSEDLIIYENKKALIDCLINDGGSVWSKIYKRSVIGDILFPEGRVFEDTAVMYKYIANARRVGYWGKIFYNYYYNYNSISQTSFYPKARWDYAIARKEALEYAIDNGLSCVVQCRSMYIKALLSCLTSIYACGNEADKKLYLPEIRGEIFKHRRSGSYAMLNPKYKVFLFLFGRLDIIHKVSAKISLASKKLKVWFRK